ncbi:unnamed protein product, partial [Prorocentrum cordatum]
MYAPTAKFFAVLPVDRKTKEVIVPDGWTVPNARLETDPSEARRAPEAPTLAVEPLAEPGEREVVHRLYATRLFLVVLVLEATDIFFAVDSVSAIVAQIPDLFLAYTACVFAMLGLRATFFVVDELVRLFFLL